MPAVVLTGARQTGKRTLAEELVPGQRRYHSLDALDARETTRRYGLPLPQTKAEIGKSARCGFLGFARNDKALNHNDLAIMQILAFVRPKY